jgi:hypothetical protein
MLIVLFQENIPTFHSKDQGQLICIKKPLMMKPEASDHKRGFKYLSIKLGLVIKPTS